MSLILFFYLLIGAVAGVLVGLLGIGGGTIIVPVLLYLFTYLKFPAQALMHMATSTSLATMIFTAAMATWRQHKKGMVQWEVCRFLIPVICLGTMIGVWIASFLSTYALKAFFSCFMFYMSFRLFQQKEEQVPKPMLLWVKKWSGFLVGILAGMLGIGGGTLTVPVLLRFGLTPHQAVGTSSACVFVLSIVGTLSFIIAGQHLTGLPPGFTGYIYWPAAIGVSIGGLLCVPLGTTLGHRLPGHVLKRIFAGFLALGGVDMLVR